MAIHETTPLLGSSDDARCSSELSKGTEKPDIQFSRAQLLGLISALSGIILAYADNSIALSIHEVVASQFDDLEYSSWMITGFTIGYCVTLPLYGQLSDTYGRQRPLVFAYSIFCVGNFLTAIGSSYVEVIAGRVIAGCGGSGMISLVAIIVIDIAPPSEVAIWRSYVSVAAVLGHSLGGPIGGILAETIGWRWSFIGQVPIATLLCISTHFSLRAISKTSVVEDQVLLENEADEVEKPTIWTFDFPGAITLAIAITSLLVVIDMKNKFAWGSPLIMITVVTGLLSTASFVAFESFGKRKPLIPLSLLKTEVGFFCLTQFFMMSGRFGFLAHIAPYFVRTQGASDSQAGSYIVPSSVGNAVGALIAGRTLKSPWEAFEVFLPGVFTGMMLSLQFIGLSLLAPKSQIATAISINYMSQQFGIATGVCLASSLVQTKFQGTLETALVDIPNYHAIIKELILDSSYTMTLPEGLRSLVWQCYLQSFWVVPAFYVASQVACIIPMVSTTDKLLAQ